MRTTPRLEALPVEDLAGADGGDIGLRLSKRAGLARHRVGQEVGAVL